MVPLAPPAFGNGFGAGPPTTGAFFAQPATETRRTNAIDEKRREFMELSFRCQTELASRERLPVRISVVAGVGNAFDVLAGPVHHCDLVAAKARGDERDVTSVRRHGRTLVGATTVRQNLH